MAINKNHEFEDLDGIKCAVVEKNVPEERVPFLKELLELNGYTVVIVKTPPPKIATKPVTATATDQGVTETQKPEIPEPPPTFTIGVTDVSFNATNAIFGRALKTRDGHVVTLAYWEQKETVSHDEIPYFEAKNN